MPTIATAAHDGAFFGDKQRVGRLSVEFEEITDLDVEVRRYDSGRKIAVILYENDVTETILLVDEVSAHRLTATLVRTLSESNLELLAKTLDDAAAGHLTITKDPDP